MFHISGVIELLEEVTRVPEKHDVTEFEKNRQDSHQKQVHLYMSRVMRKPVFMVSDQVRRKHGCKTEDG